MGWLTSLFGIDQAERAVTMADVYGDTWAPSWDSVMSVANDKALSLVPVYSSVGLIADSYAALPIDFFKKASGHRLPIPDPKWWGRPDPRVSLYDWKHQMLTSLLLRGNAYGLVRRDSYGRIQHVLWLPPSKVRVDETEFLPRYYLGGSSEGHLNIASGGDILHIPAFVVPGSVVGLSPVTLFRRQLEMHRSALLTGHEFYEERAMPSGILKNSAATMNTDQADEAKGRFKSSLKNGGVLTLDKNWSWEKVSLDPADAQFIETMKLSANQIAAIFRVDPEDVGGVGESSLKYSTVEGNQRKFNNRTLLSWTVRLEYALAVLLGDDEFVKHNLDALARPNLLELVRSISEELRAGTLTLAEARSLRDRVPLNDEQIEQWQQWFATQRRQTDQDASPAPSNDPKAGD